MNFAIILFIAVPGLSPVAGEPVYYENEDCAQDGRARACIHFHQEAEAPCEGVTGFFDFVAELPVSDGDVIAGSASSPDLSDNFDEDDMEQLPTPVVGVPIIPGGVALYYGTSTFEFDIPDGESVTLYASMKIGVEDGGPASPFPAAHAEKELELNCVGGIVILPDILNS